MGELPDADRSLGEYDGFVITGSRHDAHGDERWLEDLRAYVRHLVKNRKRVLGICFGHQLVANALGGASGRSEVGMQMGLREVMPTDAMRRAWYASGLLDAPGSTYHVHQLHQDQVLRLPESATLLASTPHTPVEVRHDEELRSRGDHIRPRLDTCLTHEQTYEYCSVPFEILVPRSAVIHSRANELTT